MTAKEQLLKWKEQHRKLDKVEEREAFYKKLEKEISGQSGDELKEGIVALKEVITEQRIAIEKKEKAAVQFQIETSSEEDIVLLRKLLKRLKIPFKEVKTA